MADDRYLVTPRNCPALEGWISLPDAARRMGVTRAWMNDLAWQGRIRTLRWIGNILVMKEQEMKEPAFPYHTSSMPGKPSQIGLRDSDAVDVVSEDRASA